MGPYGAGKTTLAERIARLLEWPRLSLDEMQRTYLKEMNNFAQVEQVMHKEKSTSPLLQPYHAYVVERAFQDLQRSPQAHVVEFGYGHSVYEDSTYISRVTEALSRYPNTFLIVPSPDPQEAADLLYGNIMSHPLKRYVATRETIYEINEHAVRLYSRYPLAKHVVYTKGSTAEQTCDYILNLVRFST